MGGTIRSPEGAEGGTREETIFGPTGSLVAPGHVTPWGVEPCINWRELVYHLRVQAEELEEGATERPFQRV